MLGVVLSLSLAPRALGPWKRRYPTFDFSSRGGPYFLTSNLTCALTALLQNWGQMFAVSGRKERQMKRNILASKKNHGFEITNSEFCRSWFINNLCKVYIC